MNEKISCLEVSMLNCLVDNFWTKTFIEVSLVQINCVLVMYISKALAEITVNVIRTKIQRDLLLFQIFFSNSSQILI